MNTEHSIPIMRRDFSIIDREFGSMRERFEDDMKRMDDEMERLRREIFEGNRRLTTSSSSQKTTTTHTKTSTGNFKSELNTWLDNLESPLIGKSEEGQGKELKLRFDVSQYAPEEIVVKTVDNKLKVHAKHEEKTENRSVYREYNREFLLPEGTNPEAIKSSLSKDGILTIEAPLPSLEAAKEHLIPIAKS